MARVHGKDFTSISMDDSGGTGREIKAEVISLDLKTSADTHDTTTIGDSWKEVTAGLKGGDEITINMFYNNAATASGGTYLLVTGRLGVEGTLSVTDGTRTMSAETIVTGFSLPINVADMTKLSVTHKLTGTVTFS